MRLDKWLWQARFFRTRGLATAEVAAGHVRVNGVKAAKPAHPLHSGDVLTFPQGGRVRLIRVRACSQRRGPAAEAIRLYVDLDATEDAGNPLVRLND
ncbi:RNA-binding S4 domain-containing protein [Paracoccaceae bacterium Fryx2]|nr:RNA-binding S4 domain-containing protein [Paracoccaceae bacterium Fryx2]